MADLPQLADTQPVLNPQGVSSSATGKEAFAKVLGAIAKESTDQVKDMLDEQSNAMALQSQNSIADTVTGAHINMIENPNQAMHIRDQSRETINQIVNTSFVNRKHRGQLKHLGTTAMNQVDLLAATTNHRQIIADAQISLHKEVPEALKDIDRLYLAGDFKSAEMRQNNLQQTVDSALKIGAITPTQYGTFSKLIQNTIVTAKQNFQMLSGNTATAYDYHKVNNTMYGSINTNAASTPVTEYTAQQTEHYNDEASYQRVASDLYRYGHVTNPMAFNNLKPSKQQQLYMQFLGVNEAQSKIQAGVPHLEIQREYENLASNSKIGLTLREEGKYKYYRNYFNRLENGDFVNVMKESPQGQRIYQEKVLSDKAIQGSPALSDAEKALRLKQNEDWERQQYISLGQALHVNPKYIKPISQEAMLPYKTAFQQGQNPDLLISNLRATDSALHPYIADSMDTQNQSAVVYMLSQAGEGITQGMAQTMIRANQEGFDKKLVDIDKDSKKISQIRGAIANDPNVQKAMQYISQLPHDIKNGQPLSDGIIEAMTNTVIMMAKSKGDYGVSNMTSYVASVSDQVKKAYVMYEDANMRVNNASLKLAEADLRAIGIYAKDKAYDQMKGQLSPVEFLDYFDRHPLVLINTPNNNFVMINSTTGDIALDKDGHPLFEWPMTDALTNAARVHKRKYDDEAARRVREFKERHPFGYTFR